MFLLDVLIMIANNAGDMPEHDDKLLNWILWGIAVVVGTLGTAIGALFKINEAKNSRAIKQMRGDHAESIERIKEEHAKSLARLESDLATKTQRYDQRWKESEARYDQCLRDRDELGRECAGLKTRCELMEQHIANLESRLNGNGSHR